jgi:hypothetical protein
MHRLPKFEGILCIDNRRIEPGLAADALQGGGINVADQHVIVPAPCEEFGDRSTNLASA